MTQTINIHVLTPSQTSEPVSCANCQACCCRLTVMIISDTGVPSQYIDYDEWGSEVMRRSDDGWCVALDRDSLLCGIYENRPWVCRAFEMAGEECLQQRQQDLVIV